MPTVPGKRHSVQGRTPATDANEARWMKEDRIEHLVEVMVNTGSDYIINKTEDKFEPGEVATSPDAMKLADPLDVANKVMKAAARELARNEAHSTDGHIESGSLAAKAQQVVDHKDDPSHPAHAVAEKIRQRFINAEKLAEQGPGHGSSPSMFVGVNPDAGMEKSNQKMRHHAEITGKSLTAGTRFDRNPDVLKD